VTQLASDAEKPSPRLNTYLINANAGCDVNQVYCVLSAATKIDGIHVQYTLQEPSQLPSDTPWFGGFVDPTSGELYDLFGRAYMVNKNKQIQSLPVVKLN